MRAEVDNSNFYGPWKQLYCPKCGFQHIHQCSESKISHDRRTWLRVLLTNWWENGWKMDIDYGGYMPVGYGLSWMKQSELRIVMHPIPFNVVMRTAREFWCWLVRGGPVQHGSVQDRIDVEVARRMQWRERKMREVRR